MFAQTPLPAMVRTREVGVAASGLRDERVVGELVPVVVGDGEDEFPESAGGTAQGTRRLRLGLSNDPCREHEP